MVSLRRALPSVALAFIASCGPVAAPTDAGDARTSDTATPRGDATFVDAPLVGDEGNGEDSTVDVATIDDQSVPPLDAPSSPDARSTPDAPSTPADAGARDVATPPTDAGADPCEPFGRFAAPTNTFTIPAPPRGNTELYYPDVQRSFATVNWATLDRLYIPAGNYSLINLGNLPNRAPDRPLVITNIGGQVNITVPRGSRQGYIWVLSGGANWVVTGRYDPTARTGDAAFPGHRCGRYANSQGTYGILSDGQFVGDGHMGLAVGDATSYEIEFIEVRRSGFAGIRLLNRTRTDGTTVPMDNVRVHDTYVHDTKSEGFYFGWTGDPPSVRLNGLQVYNNRVLRTGTETAQLQNLGDGTQVHHNVFAFGAIDWRAAFSGYQDNGSQTSVRAGTISFHHNVIMGGAQSLVNYFSIPETGDGARNATYSDNYFADTLWLGIYLGGNSGADSRFAFTRNVFRGLDFGYAAISPSATDPGVVLRVGATITSPIDFSDNRWEGTRRIVSGLSGTEGSAASLTARRNTNAAVAPYTFVNSGLPAGTRTRALEMWAATATLHPMQPMVRYEPGSFVMYDGDLYECLAANSNAPPPMNPTLWRRLPAPADDVRPARDNPYAGVGLLPRSP